jgi:hypothetical protein
LLSVTIDRDQSGVKPPHSTETTGEAVMGMLKKWIWSSLAELF